VWGEQDQIFPVQMAHELKEYEFFASFTSIFSSSLVPISISRLLKGEIFCL